MTDEDGEVRELTEDDFAAAVPFSALPESLRAKLSALTAGQAQAEPAGARIAVPLPQDIVDRFRATGEGWQARMDEALRDWIRNHPPA